MSLISSHHQHIFFPEPLIYFTQSLFMPFSAGALSLELARARPPHEFDTAHSSPLYDFDLAVAPSARRWPARGSFWTTLTCSLLRLHDTDSGRKGLCKCDIAKHILPFSRYILFLLAYLCLFDTQSSNLSFSLFFVFHSPKVVFFYFTVCVVVGLRGMASRLDMKMKVIRLGIVVLGALAFGYLSIQIGFKPYLEKAQQQNAILQSDPDPSSSPSQESFSFAEWTS